MSSVQNSDRGGAKKPTTKCPLLELPAELRNDIYELAFSLEHDANAEVDLHKTEPPSKSLILTSKQVHKEASGLYITAYRRFWETSNFTLTSQQALPPMKEADLSHITQCSIKRSYETYELGDNRGIWHQEERHIGSGSRKSWLAFYYRSQAAIAKGFVTYEYSRTKQEALDFLANNSSQPAVPLKRQIEMFWPR